MTDQQATNVVKASLVLFMVAWCVWFLQPTGKPPRSDTRLTRVCPVRNGGNHCQTTFLDAVRLQEKNRNELLPEKLLVRTVPLGGSRERKWSRHFARLPLR